MGNFYQIFIVLAEHENISLNTDILETGVLNIIALIVLVITSLQKDLTTQIEERNEIIKTEVENAENNYKNARKKTS